MKKSFKLTNLDCAVCAGKMEERINKLEGVILAKVSFMTQRLTLEANDDIFEDVLRLSQTEISKVEPDCKIVM